MFVKTSEAVEALRAALELSNRKMPMGPAMAIRKLIRELSGIQQDAQELHRGLLERFADKDEHGEEMVNENDQVQFSGDGEKLFGAAYQELLDALVDVDASLSSRGLEQMEIEPRLLVALGDLFVDAEEPVRAAKAMPGSNGANPVRKRKVRA